MELNLTITPNTAAAILEALQPAVLRFFEALVNAARGGVGWDQTIGQGGGQDRGGSLAGA